MWNSAWTTVNPVAPPLPSHVTQPPLPAAPPPAIPAAPATPMAVALNTGVTAQTAPSAMSSPYGHYTAAQYAALTTEQQYALQQHWQQWQIYQQEYAKWHAQYGEQYNREMAAAAVYQQPPLPAQPPPLPPQNETVAAPPLPEAPADPTTPIQTNVKISAAATMYNKPPQKQDVPQHAPSPWFSNINKTVFTQPPPNFQQPPPPPKQQQIPQGWSEYNKPPNTNPEAKQQMLQFNPNNFTNVPPPAIPHNELNKSGVKFDQSQAQRPQNSFENQNFNNNNSWNPPGRNNRTDGGNFNQINRPNEKNNIGGDNARVGFDEAANRWAGNFDNEKTGGNFGVDKRNFPPGFVGKNIAHFDNAWQGGNNQRAPPNDRWSNNNNNTNNQITNNMGTSNQNRWGNMRNNDDNFNNSNRNEWGNTLNDNFKQNTNIGGGPGMGPGLNERGYNFNQGSGDRENFMNRPPKQPQISPDKAEELFDRQFRAWEDQFEDWKRTNINNPDREWYNRCFQQFENQRKHLIEKRTQMGQRRLSQMGQQQQIQPPSQEKQTEQQQAQVKQQNEQLSEDQLNKIEPEKKPAEDANKVDEVPTQPEAKADTEETTNKKEDDTTEQRLAKENKAEEIKRKSELHIDEASKSKNSKTEESKGAEEEYIVTISLDDDDEQEESNKKITSIFDKGEGIPGLDLVEGGDGLFTEKSTGTECEKDKKNEESEETVQNKLEDSKDGNKKSEANEENRPLTQQIQESSVGNLPIVINALRNADTLQNIIQVLAQIQGLNQKDVGTAGQEPTENVLQQLPVLLQKLQDQQKANAIQGAKSDADFQHEKPQSNGPQGNFADLRPHGNNEFQRNFNTNEPLSNFVTSQYGRWEGIGQIRPPGNFGLGGPPGNFRLGGPPGNFGLGGPPGNFGLGGPPGNFGNGRTLDNVGPGGHLGNFGHARPHGNFGPARMQSNFGLGERNFNNFSGPNTGQSFSGPGGGPPFGGQNSGSSFSGLSGAPKFGGQTLGPRFGGGGPGFGGHCAAPTNSGNQDTFNNFGSFNSRRGGLAQNQNINNMNNPFRRNSGNIGMDNNNEQSRVGERGINTAKSWTKGYVYFFSFIFYGFHLIK